MWMDTSPHIHFFIIRVRGEYVVKLRVFLNGPGRDLLTRGVRGSPFPDPMNDVEHRCFRIPIPRSYSFLRRRRIINMAKAAAAKVFLGAILNIHRSCYMYVPVFTCMPRSVLPKSTEFSVLERILKNDELFLIGRAPSVL